MTTFAALDRTLARLDKQDGVLVQVVETRGSVPRAVGAWLVAWPNDLTASIGGGNLEFQALTAARAMLASSADAPTQDEVRSYALGPSLGQCCGGMVFLRYQRITAADGAALQERLGGDLTPVALFGNGHVGKALVAALRPLPFQVRWVDHRDDDFPTDVSPRATIDNSDPMHMAVADLAPASRVLIMSHDHWEDLEIVRVCLERIRRHDDLPFIGLIGSKTKWAMFRHRLQARGFSDAELARVTCPIGIVGVDGKEPEIIAVAVAAQLLQERSPPTDKSSTDKSSTDKSSTNNHKRQMVLQP